MTQTLRRAGLVVAMLALTGAAPPAAAPALAPWDRKWFDPKPSSGADELVLPLPCGGAMVFVAVDVPSGQGPLADATRLVGEPETQLGYIDFVRTAYLAAPFAGEGANRRYWIGKYDVTRDQYAAIQGDPCPTPSPGGRLPQASVSWIDATQSAAALSSWLLGHAREKLPRRGAGYAFARLPTEDEWEYAARGGAKVGEADFTARTWPMPEGIERYAQAGAEATAGRAQQVGQLLPNPLGLYDMLGDVDQMMADPFRLNRVGRPHGQAGGIAARGGNYNTPPSALASAMRVEIPPYDPRTNAPTKLPTLGFRLVLSAITVGSLQDTEAAQQEFDQENNAPTAAVDDPRRLIDQLRKATADQTVQRGLNELSATLDQAEGARRDQARTAMDAQIEAAAVLAHFVWSLERYARLQEVMADTIFAQNAAEQADLHAKATERRDEQKASLDGYLRLVRQLGTGPAANELGPQMQVVQQEFKDRGQRQLFAFMPVVRRHATEIQNGHIPSQAAARADILAVRGTEPEPQHQ